jgi:hypothetical protein
MQVHTLPVSANAEELGKVTNPTNGKKIKAVELRIATFLLNFKNIVDSPFRLSLLLWKQKKQVINSTDIVQKVTACLSWFHFYISSSPIDLYTCGKQIEVYFRSTHSLTLIYWTLDKKNW